MKGSAFASIKKEAYLVLLVSVGCLVFGTGISLVMIHWSPELAKVHLMGEKNEQLDKELKEQTEAVEDLMRRQRENAERHMIDVDAQSDAGNP